MTDQRYIYAWGNNSKRKTLKGRECVVLARMKKNSIVISFTDNWQVEVTSRNAIRLVTTPAGKVRNQPPE